MQPHRGEHSRCCGSILRESQPDPATERSPISSALTDSRVPESGLVVAGVNRYGAPIEDAQVRVLVVEHDPDLAQSIQAYLESQGLKVYWEQRGTAAIDHATRVCPDVVLLGALLPDCCGLQACERLRAASDVPIILLGPQNGEEACVVGLENGADDYLRKPFSVRELLARIRAHVRRVRGCASPGSRVVQVGDLTVDPRAMCATLGGRRLCLTSYEFRLLQVLADHAGRPLPRERLVDLVRGSPDKAFDRSIDVHISRLRNKLGDDPRDPRVIKTVRGAGYLLAASLSASDLCLPEEPSGLTALDRESGVVQTG